MFASDWFISLFTSTMPISRSTKLFNVFFKHGWVAVYKLILMILKKFQKTLLQSKEAGDILISLKNNDLFALNLNP